MSDARRFRKVAELFEAVRAKDRAERDAFLADAGRSCPEAVAEVRRLLAHHDEGGVLDTPILPREAASDVARAVGASPLPARIGPYRVIRELGVGGMGIVCLAEQDNPRREVAIKLIRPGLVTRDLLKRFDRETALLGRLQHPGIARIYEAGTYDDGSGARPFFAMEFVDGAPLLDHVREQDLHDRLETFARICDAVEHAHRRGIIHRDLKPGNILVDRSGQPRILDFGVARATESDLQASTLQTAVGQLIGTVAYMSPEQVCGRGTDIDTRSDVYGLGVILYELIADRLPYDLDGRTIAAAARVISEEDPTALSTLNHSYRGDLHTIVHKTLEKEPDRRYQSASALAADIRHFLDDEPIVARPATTMYQLRKFARRNKALVAGVMIAFLAIGAGAIGATIGMIRAQDEAERAQAMTAFLEDVLVAADSARSGNVRLVDVLRDAGARVDSEFADLPELAVRIHELLAVAFLNIAYFDEAAHHAERWRSEVEARFGSGHVATHRPRIVLAKVLRGRMRLEESEALVRAVVDALDPRAHDAVAIDARLTLGNLLMLRGSYEEAERLLRDVLDEVESEHGPLHPLTVRSRNFLGRTLDNRAMHGGGEPSSNESLRREAAALFRQVVDDEHEAGRVSHDGLDALTSLSAYARAAGRYDEAAAYAREGMELAEPRLGSDHPIMAAFRRRLGRALFGSGQVEEAARHMKDAVAWARDTQRNRLRTSVTMAMAFPILDAAGEWETCLEYAEYIVAQYADSAHQGTGFEARIWLPYLHTRLGALEKAAALFEPLLEIEAGLDDQHRARLHYARGIWFMRQDDPETARGHLELAYELCDDQLFRWPDRRAIGTALEGLTPR